MNEQKTVPSRLARGKLAARVDQSRKSRIPIVLSVLSLVMIYFSYSAVYAMNSFYDLTDDPKRSECLLVVGYLVVYSTVVWVPYIIMLPFNIVTKNKIWVAATTIPFLVMLVVVIIAQMNGAKW